MKWPFISRETHDEIVRELKNQLDASEHERKKAQDEILRLLGGKPYHFPDGNSLQTSAEAEVEAQAPEEEDVDAAANQILQYATRARKDLVGPIMAKLQMRPKTFKPKPDPKQKEVVTNAFDQAHQEATNGHRAS